MSPAMRSTFGNIPILTQGPKMPKATGVTFTMPGFCIAMVLLCIRIEFRITNGMRFVHHRAKARKETWRTIDYWRSISRYEPKHRNHTTEGLRVWLTTTTTTAITSFVPFTHTRAAVT